MESEKEIAQNIERIIIEYSKCLYKPYWNNGVLYLPIGWKDEVEKKIRKECSNGD